MSRWIPSRTGSVATSSVRSFSTSLKSPARLRSPVRATTSAICQAAMPGTRHTSDPFRQPLSSGETDASTGTAFFNVYATASTTKTSNRYDGRITNAAAQGSTQAAAGQRSLPRSRWMYSRNTRKPSHRHARLHQRCASGADCHQHKNEVGVRVEPKLSYVVLYGRHEGLCCAAPISRRRMARHEAPPFDRVASMSVNDLSLCVLVQSTQGELAPVTGSLKPPQGTPMSKRPKVFVQHTPTSTSSENRSQVSALPDQTDAERP